MNKAFFFDRDGIVNVKLENDYIKSIDEFIFKQVFFQLFKLIKEQNYLTILVTNQQCVGKGIITDKELQKIHSYMQTELLKHTNYEFDDIYYCSALANTGSKYRKPEIGMFEEAIKKHNIDPNLSWTIGDSISDVQAGSKIGTKTILVNERINNIDVNSIDADLICNDLVQVYNHFLNIKGK
jgi:D-glycero-D-manno-heptose 1,7-bisphosphate phosphatase